MLVLTRQKQEVIVIGESGKIILEILDVHENRVRIGVSAPKDVLVHRREVYVYLQRRKLMKGKM